MLHFFTVFDGTSSKAVPGALSSSQLVIVTLKACRSLEKIFNKLLDTEINIYLYWYINCKSTQCQPLNENENVWSSHMFILTKQV